MLEAKEELRAILHIISSVEEPEPGLLDDLERKLDAAEKQYQEAGIELRLSHLYEERRRQVTHQGIGETLTTYTIHCRQVC